MARKAAAGTGTIRKKTITRGGKQYTYWEARATVGYDPGTGKQIQRTFTAKTQKEVAQKLKAATAALDDGTYTAPSKMTVSQWLDIWTAEYLGGVKPATVASYKTIKDTHLKPGLGATKLEALNAHTIQGFYNGLVDPQRGGTVSAKTVKNIHGVLHKAMQQAVSNGYIRFNPTEACTLPRIEKKEIQPLDETQITAFLKAIRGHRFENLYTVTLFTGLREGEVLGLMWDCVDLDKGTLLINKQLQLSRGSGGEYVLVPTKNSKGRSITLPPFIVATLRKERRSQLENKLRYGECWSNSGFVFTDELGCHLKHSTVYKNFKAITRELGLPAARFHDLRHSYAVASIRSGDDIKTVQENLGHATASFTLDVYGHVTEQMKRESADRMERYIHSVTG